MNNKVRISYAVPILQVPEEIQKLVDRMNSTLAGINATMENIDFNENFELSFRRAQSLAISVDSLDSNISDITLLAEGFLEIQNKLASDQTEPEETPKEQARSSSVTEMIVSLLRKGDVS